MNKNVQVTLYKGTDDQVTAFCNFAKQINYRCLEDDMQLRVMAIVERSASKTDGEF